MPQLPNGFISIDSGSNHYFSYDGVFYTKSKTGYRVINDPVQINNTSTPPDFPKLIIYPANNQSNEQKNRDKYECHEWAVSESSIDPTAHGPNTALQSDYDRAIKACLEARQYVVK